MLDRRPLELVGIRGDAVTPTRDQLITVEREPFEEAGEHLLVRRADDLLEPHERAVELRIHPLDRRVPDLHGDPAHVELDEVRRCNRDRVRAA